MEFFSPLKSSYQLLCVGQNYAKYWEYLFELNSIMKETQAKLEIVPLFPNNIYSILLFFFRMQYTGA